MMMGLTTGFTVTVRGIVCKRGFGWRVLLSGITVYELIINILSQEQMAMKDEKNERLTSEKEKACPVDGKVTFLAVEKSI